jgi:hypothetical protein
MDASKTLWQLPPVGTLSGSIQGLTQLDQWTVDLIEPVRGLPISAGTSLTLLVGSTGAQLSAQISPAANPGAASPIVRLSPIKAGMVDPTRPTVDPTRPTVYWKLDDISGGTQQSPVVTLNNDVVASGTEVDGQILGADGTSGVAAQLTFQSQKLSMDSNASFVLAASTDVNGRFSVNLPPGDYWVRAVPVAADGLSITDDTLMWPMSVPMGGCVCGKTFQLDPQTKFTGMVQTPTGEPVASTSVAVAASEALVSSYLQRTLTLGPLPARAVSGTTDGNGRFSLLLDRGTSDFTVEPDPATNFPWLVKSSMTPMQETPYEKPPLRLTSPAFLGGTVTDPRGMPVANAEVDAWFAVRDATKPSRLAGTVVKIATTSTDANGAYTLVLPSSL